TGVAAQLGLEGSGMRRRLVVGLFCALLALLGPSVASAQSSTVTSFDGTRIHVNFFAAANLARGKRAPTGMLGPGSGSPGDTNPNDSTDVSAGIPGGGTLRRGGLNLLTWGPPGLCSSRR